MQSGKAFAKGAADPLLLFEGRRAIRGSAQGDGTRAFYESLFEENRNSLVAIK